VLFGEMAVFSIHTKRLQMSVAAKITGVEFDLMVEREAVNEMGS